MTVDAGLSAQAGGEGGQKARGGKKRYVKAIGPNLRRLLQFLFGLFALLGVTAVYLGTITAIEFATGRTYQNYFYQLVFLVHLLLGFLMVVPFLIFGVIHIKNTHNRPNRRAVMVGYALFATCLLLLASGIVLTRLDGFELRDPNLRSSSYWIHVVTPFLCVWLFVLHRLAGRRIKWKIGAVWMGSAAVFTLVMALLHSQDPKQWGRVGPQAGEQYFFPSLARTASGDFIDADLLMNDSYCMECHADVHERWSHSAHHLASFNNPVYLFSVRETRAAMLERDGNLQGARFCAGCHDVVPFFSGAFDDPNYDDVNDPTSQAGITCTACHAITHINSPRGNADYTIEAPSHYPFAFSKNPVLAWINRQLVKAKPEFHKKTFLKPLHKTPEFCGSCHKVHLPEELNAYKWLRGQNHYDSFLLSGVSGHGVSSFYYPKKAEENCNQCHLPLLASDDFGADYRDASGQTKVHDHLFPSANTAVPKLVGSPEWVTEAHREFNQDVMRVDIFGVKQGGTIEGELVAPLDANPPALVPGQSILFEVVIRTLKLGHHFTQGTTDSNEVWLEVTALLTEPEGVTTTLGHSGRMSAAGAVDPWSYFVNNYLLDRDGRRIARRNPQDIFVALYNHQIPPGAADVVHYALELPADVQGELTLDVKLRYRKFDATLMKLVQGDRFEGNNLPVLELAQDRVVFPIASDVQQVVGDPEPGPKGEAHADPFEEWQRWNDFGIGLLRKSAGAGTSGQLREAESAFKRVEALGRPDGPLNLARVYLREGRLDEAASALRRAAAFDPPAPVWSVAWFSGLVDKQNGFLDQAIEAFEGIVGLDDEETRSRGFDFSKDYRLLNELGQTLVERAKQERGTQRRAQREVFLSRAKHWFESVLELDPENLEAHYNLSVVYEELGDVRAAREHRGLHEKYKPDDNARDLATAKARIADPAADHAAEAVAIYDLQRENRTALQDD